MKSPLFTYSCQSFTPIQRRFGGRGNKIMTGTVVKAKVGELEDEVREGFFKRMRKYLTGMLE